MRIIMAGGVASATVGAANGQSLNIDRQGAPAGATDGLSLRRPMVPGHLEPTLRLTLDVVHDAQAAENSVLGRGYDAVRINDRVVGTLAFGLGIAGDLGFYGVVPVTLMADTGVQPGVAVDPGTGLGDPSLVGRFRILGDGLRGPGLAAEAGLTLPLATGGPHNLNGDPGPAAPVGLIYEHVFARWRCTANLGALFRFEAAGFEGLGGTISEVTHELRWAAGAGVSLLPELEVVAEALGHTPLSRPGEPTETPVSWVAGVQSNWAAGWFAGLGAGTGLTPRAGGPVVQVLAAVGWAEVAQPAPVLPAPVAPKDADADGIGDATDDCPDKAEDHRGALPADGCPAPDTDGDGLDDLDDSCPDDAEDADGFQDQDGCPDRDNDRDGLLDAADKCPMQLETLNGHLDTDGCPDGDMDNDSVFDDEDACPRAPGRPHERGCPRGIRLDDRSGVIDVVGRLDFVRGGDAIHSSTLPVLYEVKALLAANPEIRRVRIEVPATPGGELRRGLEAGLVRAVTVQRWLVARGVESGRLAAFACEIEPNGTRPAAQPDRSSSGAVTFRIVDPTPGAAAPIPANCLAATPP